MSSVEINTETPSQSGHKKDITEMMKRMDTNDTTDIDKEQMIGKTFFDNICFKYSDMPAAIYVDRLQNNIVGS